MALRVAIANGNWSNPAIWNNGVLPAAGDIVASNGFTVTIDQNITVDRLTNAATAPVIVSAPMTSHTTPSGIVTASSILYGQYDSWLAFDQLTFTEWLSSTFAPSQWLAYEFTSAKVIKSYQMNPAGNNAPSSVPRDWTFEGWNGSSWVVLDTVTGNSGTAIVSRTISNTTAYIKYRINITANNGYGAYTGIRELSMYEANDYMTNSVAGGGFVINDGVSIVTTNTVDGFTQNTGSTLFTYNGTSSANLSGRITTYLGYVASTYYLVNHTGSGTLNFVGDLILHGRNFYTNFNLTGSGTLNYTGNITTPFNQAEIRSRFLNLVGTLSTAYVTGNISTVTNITANSYAVFGTLNGKLYITGSLLMGLTPIISSGESSLLSIVGPISKDNTLGTIVEGTPAVVRSSSSAINLFTGPFISSRYGTMPILCVRMHLIPNAASYFEFRDETTNGALSPGAIAPATRLVAVGGAVDAPAPNNVRQGVTYASASLIGTMVVPSPSNVVNNVPVDNTVGTAVLDPAAIWSVPLTSINTLNSIGRRVKNAATVETTGAQIQTILNNNE